jgi:hypothetical protein
MKLTTFSFGAASSKLRKNDMYENSIFLHEIYDSAIVGYDLFTGSIIYSLRRLVFINMETMENNGESYDFFDREDLFHFLYECFYDLISDFHNREDGIPPIILQDIDIEYKKAA